MNRHLNFPITAMVCIITLVAVILSGLSTNKPRPVFSWASEGRLVPIYKVETDEKKVAISFDAAWGSDVTPRLLDILERHKVKTTFFLVKFWMEDYPEMTETISQAGHEIGNHSATHPNMGGLSKEQIIEEIVSTHDKIMELTGKNPTLFRPPFGDYSNTLIETANSLDYQVIQWSIDSLDWKDLSADAIYDRVMKQMSPGSIILFHNNGKYTAEAVENILKALLDDGYSVVPISELLIKGEYHIDKNTGEMKKGL